MSLLIQANEAFKNKNYVEAYEIYQKAKGLYKFDFLDFNISLCMNKIGNNKLLLNDISKINHTQNIVTVDIIIPIYNALEDVKNCINSLYEHKTYNFNIIAIDDCSDEETKNYLEKESKRRGFKLLRNKENLRFTKTVNRGFKESKGDYVVLLNSDTIVTPRWIEKILACFDSDPKIGIVGPLSNAASWQTVPVRDDKEFGGWLVNEIPNGYSVEEMGMLVETISKKLYPKVPSVNGFCYVIKRELLDKNGSLDEEYFPTGYGEEDDFSIRAIDAGFKIAVADDTYIFHAKSKSYTHEVRAVLSVKGRKALDAKHGKERLKELVNNWKAEPTLPTIAKHIESYMQIATTNKKVVYTAIFGNYDSVKEPEYINKDWDYICYTNNKNLKSETFTVKYVDAIFDNQTKNARMIKILSHIFFIGYDYSLWIDGNVMLRGRNIEALIKNNKSGDYISLHQHVKRDCVFDEVQACINAKKDNPDLMLKQLDKYRKEGFPTKIGLVETAEIVRQQNHKNTKRLNLLWWDELNNNSIRDQLSFNYICWKNSFHYSVMEGIQWLDPYFNIYKHGNKNIQSNIQKVAIVIVIQNLNITNIEKMIDNLIKTTNYPKYKIILTNTTNNLDIDNILNKLKNIHNEVKIMGSCKGKSLVNAKNYIAKKLISPYICFMDENCKVIESNWLQLLMYELAQNNQCVIAGPTIIDDNYKILSSSIQIKQRDRHFVEAKDRKKLGGTGNVYAVSDKCILVEKDAFMKVNKFSCKYDSRNATIDLCFKFLKHDFNTRFVLNAQIIDKSTILSEKEQLISSHSLRADWEKSDIFKKDINNLSSKKKISIIPQYQGNGTYTSTGFIRLVYPYSSLKTNYNIGIHKNIKEVIKTKPDIIIIQRYSININDFKEIRSKLKDSKIIYDIDDDLITHFEDDKNKVETIKYFLKNSNKVTVSTENLYLEYKKYNSCIYKVNNLLNSNIWDSSIFPLKEYKTVNILYMGSKSHYEDFLLVENDLIKLKKHYRDKINIDIIGVMDKKMYTNKEYFNYITPPEFARNQYDEFVKWITKENRWHIGIAPLENTSFNSKKSYIKYLDYSALGLLTVASNIVPYTDIIKDGINGVLVDEKESWFEKINELIVNINQIKKVATLAHKEFNEQHIITNGKTLIHILDN